MLEEYRVHHRNKSMTTRFTAEKCGNVDEALLVPPIPSKTLEIQQLQR